MSDRPAPDAPASAAALMTPRWRGIGSEILLGGPPALLIPLVLAVLLLAFPFVGNNPYWIRQISEIAVLALVISGVNLSFGYAGEIQFGQVFMFAFGAYLTMILAVHGLDEIVLLLVIGGLAAAAVGAIIAFPAVRIGGWSLALTSFFLIVTIPDLAAIFPNLTGGLTGLFTIPNPELAGGALSSTGLYEVAIVATILWFAVYRNLVTSRYGVIFRILRQSPVLASSLGYSTWTLKVIAYTIGAFPAGMAGCLYGFINFNVTPSTFGLSLAIGIVAGSLLGGIESVYGVFLAAALLQIGPQSSLSFAEYAPVAYGAFLIVAAVAFRSGIGGLGKRIAVRCSRLLVGETETTHIASVISLHTHLDGPAETPASGQQPDQPVIGPLSGRRLVVTSVRKSFGGNRAVDDVSLTAEPGRVTALIGANGSGKTTMLNLICGYAKVDAGSVAFGDSVLTNMAPHRIAHLGVGRTFQTPNVPRGVSVLDVVASGRFIGDRCGLFASVFRLPRYWRSRRADRTEALRLLGLMGLAGLADREATSLSLGIRRLVEVARALCARPGLLLLDEPASGLSDEETDVLGRVVTMAARAGATVVLIEHNFAFVSAICGHAHVMEFGKLIASGTPQEVARNPLVIESFLGRIASEEASTPAAAAVAADPVVIGQNLGSLIGAGAGTKQSGPLLVVRDAVSGYGDLQVLRGVSLTIESGRLEVLLGRNGVGKTTLLNTISGLTRLWEGSITFGGNHLGSEPAYRRAASGIALVQEGKRVFRQQTIMENVLLGSFTQALSRRERHDLCRNILDSFPVLKKRAGEPAGSLSGGQQQMLAIAQALASRPRLLLLDEPSAGLAPSIVSELFEQIRELCTRGMTILLVEQLAQQALRIADHVTILDNGKVMAAGAPEDFRDQQGLQEAYFGGSSRVSAAQPREAATSRPDKRAPNPTQ